MKKIFLLALIGINGYQVLAQQSSKYFERHWGKTAPIFDGASSIVQLNDSSYFVTSETHDTLPATNVKRITIFAKSGNLYAQQTDSDNAFVRGITGKIEPDHLKKTLFSGNARVWYGANGVNKSVPYIYVFDTVGNFLTPFIVGDTANIKSGAVNSIAYTTNNFIYCSGVIGILVNGQLSLRAAYWKIDTLGYTIWERRDSSSTCCVNRFSTIKEDAAGNFIMLGWFNNQNNASVAERLWLRKIDTNGNTLWDYKYDEPDIDITFNYAVLQARNLAIGNDGNYMVSGDYRAILTPSTGKPSALIKFSAIDGHIIWRYNMVTTDTTYCYGNAIEKIISIPNEGYVLFGSLFDKRGDIAAFISKVNENGQELWRKSFGTTVGHRDTQHDDYFFDGIQTLDGGYAAVGQTAGAPYLVDAWLVKTNCNGDTAAPVANFVQTLNVGNNTIATFTNLSLRFDTCVFNFGDGSALVYKSYLDTNVFTHAFPNYATNYNVSCIAKSCGNDFDTLQTQIFTGSPINLPKREAFKVLPNPNNGNFTVQVNGILTKQTILKITDTFGQIVDEVAIVNTTTKYENTSLSNGLYFYTIRNKDEEMQRGKFLVVK